MKTTKKPDTEHRKKETKTDWGAKVNAAVADLSSSLLSAAAIEDISDLVLAHAKDLTGSEFGFVGYIDPETAHLVIPTMIREIWDECRVKDKDTVFRDFRGLWGWVLNNRQPIITNSPADDPRSSGIPQGHIRIHRFLSVPAMIQGKLLGQISLANAGHDYTGKELAVTERLASLYAIAIHRNRTEKELIASEEKYRSLVENINMGIYRNTLEAYGRFLQVNHAMVKMFGYDSMEELLNMSVAELYQNPEDRKAFVAKILRQGHVHNEEIKLLRKDGTPIWASVTAKAQYDENRRMKWIDGVIEDITERKMAEKALKESQDLYRTIFETTGTTTIIVDEDMSIPMVNMECEKVLGYSREEIIGRKKWDEFIAEEDLERLRSYHRIRRISPDAVPRTYEARLIGKQGTVKKVSITADLIPGTKQSIISILDMTKRKVAEEKLVQSLETLQSVYNIATTVRGSYEAVCEQVVFNLSKLLKTPYAAVEHIEEDQVRIIARITGGNFIHNERIPLEYSPCSRAYEQNAPCQIKGPLHQLFPENMLLSQYGFRSSIAVPIRNISGKPVGAFSAMDYEERTFSEDEIRLIEIFTRYIAYEFERNVMETQLRQLDRIKLLGQMAAGVAHEVRNPLNAILAITEALFQDIGNNPEYKPYLEHIRTQVDRLSRLMGDLLDLGKPIQPSNLHRDSLISLCASTVDLWKQSPLSRTHKVSLILPDQADSFQVMADRSRLQQVFLNLLENAAQHSPEGSEIRFMVSQTKGKNARICVADEGHGIPQENFLKVFEPFFTTRKRGNGLGLSIVKNTIQAHGGDVIIRNNSPLRGCTVEIILPIL
ncbi:MAG: PAS domain S-box protein [Nitrospirota bacterium]